MFEEIGIKFYGQNYAQPSGMSDDFCKMTDYVLIKNEKMSGQTSSILLSCLIPLLNFINSYYEISSFT